MCFLPQFILKSSPALATEHTPLFCFFLTSSVTKSARNIYASHRPPLSTLLYPTASLFSLVLFQRPLQSSPGLLFLPPPPPTRHSHRSQNRVPKNATFHFPTHKPSLVSSATGGTSPTSEVLPSLTAMSPLRLVFRFSTASASPAAGDQLPRHLGLRVHSCHCLDTLGLVSPQPALDLEEPTPRLRLLSHFPGTHADMRSPLNFHAVL